MYNHRLFVTVRCIVFKLFGFTDNIKNIFLLDFKSKNINIKKKAKYTKKTAPSLFRRICTLVLKKQNYFHKIDNDIYIVKLY